MHARDARARRRGTFVTMIQSAAPVFTPAPTSDPLRRVVHRLRRACPCGTLIQSSPQHKGVYAGTATTHPLGTRK